MRGEAADRPVLNPRPDWQRVSTRSKPLKLREAASRAGSLAKGRWLDVRIRDNGPGLPPGGSERIFESDLITTTRRTGLGLALVRQAVTAAGGTLNARSIDTL